MPPTTVDSLRLPTFERFNLRLPGQLEEQRAIVDALDDAEGEIDSLAARIAKAKSIKQGMIQELLTGRTRLPVEESAA